MKDKTVYWVDWKPENGFLLPADQAFKNQASKKRKNTTRHYNEGKRQTTATLPAVLEVFATQAEQSVRLTRKPRRKLVVSTQHTEAGNDETGLKFLH